MVRWAASVDVLDLKFYGKCERIAEKLHLLSEIFPKA